MQNQTIHLKRTKTNNEFILMMTNRVQQILERRYNNKNNETWVFTDKSGKKPRNHSTIAIRNAMQKIGLTDFRVHDLRHTFASRLIRNNCTIQEAALALGHTGNSLSTTMRYAHLSQSQVAMKMRDAINSFNDG
jgi:integrase